MAERSPRSAFEPGFDFEHNPVWRVMRITSEFVEGFTFLSHIERSVTFFGSARSEPDDHYYEMARELGHRLAENGYAIVTGGGPGIMQAGNQGAAEAGGDSIGLNIQLPMEQRENPYVRHGMSFHYFFTRKVMLNFSAEAYVFFPGGFGTMDEFFELITLVQTGKLERLVPILLIGRDYWEPLIAWMRKSMLMRFHAISPNDLTIWTVTDDLDEAVAIIEHGIRSQTEERYARTGHARLGPEERIQRATQPMTGTEQ